MIALITMQFRIRREGHNEGDGKPWKMRRWSKMISPRVCLGRKSWHRADKEVAAAKRCCVDHLCFSFWRTWLKLSWAIFDGKEPLPSLAILRDNWNYPLNWNWLTWRIEFFLVNLITTSTKFFIYDNCVLRWQVIYICGFTEGGGSCFLWQCFLDS